MDYEQKYKEALEKAREIYKEDFKAMWLENIFPELKESEDEKIRKQILSFLKEFECDHYRNLDFSSCLAWLEKQGEQNSESEADLMLQVPITATKYRRMTNRELSKWLRDKPEEYRELKYYRDSIFSSYSYYENTADEPVDESIMIRSNYGEWKEPLVEEETESC